MNLDSESHETDKSHAVYRFYHITRLTIFQEYLFSTRKVGGKRHILLIFWTKSSYVFFTARIT